MKRLLASVVLFVLTANQAFAETSQSDRSNKKSSFLLGVGLRGPAYSEATLSGTYFLDPDSQVLLNVTGISGSINEKSDTKIDDRDTYFVGITTEVKGTAISLAYRRFFLDTFYVDGGLDYADVSADFQISKDIFFTADDLKTDLGSYQKLSAMVQIGNQWQWENFTLGTSWIGMLLPLANGHDFKNVFTDGKPNSVKAFEDSSENVQGSLLRFYLGWAF